MVKDKIFHFKIYNYNFTVQKKLVFFIDLMIKLGIFWD